MNQCSTFFIHSFALILIAGATCYIVLNETGRLGKVKRECYSKVMDVKEDLMKKMK